MKRARIIIVISLSAILSALFAFRHHPVANLNLTADLSILGATKGVNIVRIDANEALELRKLLESSKLNTGPYFEIQEIAFRIYHVSKGSFYPFKAGSVRFDATPGPFLIFAPDKGYGYYKIIDVKRGDNFVTLTKLDSLETRGE